MKRFKAGIVMAVVLVMSALGFMSCSSNNAKLVSITVTPVDPVIVSEIQFTANGTFSDGMVLNYTSEVVWSSSDPTVATVGTTVGLTGHVTVLTTGTTTITAVEPNNNFSSSTLLTIVTPSTITITPENPVMAKGKGRQFDAIATFVSPYTGATVTQSLLSSPSLTWNSSDFSIATVFKGLVTAVTTTAVTTTSANISASYPLFDIVYIGTTTLTVTPSILTSINVTPNPASIVISSPTPSQQFTATGTFQDIPPLDLTLSVNWSSSATGTVSVSNATGSKGLATAVGLGTAYIIATDPITNVTGSANVTVQ